MKKIVLTLLAMAFLLHAQAQKVYTKTGKISFNATSPMEVIEATTNKGVAVIDLATGKMEIQLLIKSLHFKKALMEEHFNENYMESNKYPDAKFVGEIIDFKSLSLKNDATYPIKVKGALTMHGVTKDIEATGTVIVKGGLIMAAKSAMTIKVADYNIKIPGAVKDKIATEAKITVDLPLQAIASAKVK